MLIKSSPLKKFDYKTIDYLAEKYKSLLNMNPVKIDSCPKDSPTGGVYMFSEGKDNLYVGRTKRPIKTRLKGHVSTADDCPLAWRLTKEKLNIKKATYKKETSRKVLLLNKRIRDTYENEKDRIRKMDVRYVAEADPVLQTLLEVYCAVKSESSHNEFETH